MTISEFSRSAMAMAPLNSGFAMSHKFVSIPAQTARPSYKVSGQAAVSGRAKIEPSLLHGCISTQQRGCTGIVRTV